MKVSKSSIQSLKPNLKFNHLSSEKRQVEDVGPMASLLKTRSVVRFSGPDTIKFLQGLLTNDIRKFSDEKSSLVTRNVPASLYTAMLTPQGRFLYDMFLYQPPTTDDVELLADVDSSVLEELLETLKKYRLRSKVDIQNVGDDFSCWQRYGVDHHKRQPEAASVGWQWHKDPRLDCLGFRGIFPSNTIPPMVEEADTQTEEENYLMWRLDNGVAEGSIEIPKGEAIPLEYNLAGLNAISFQKGCYIGQELIARSHHRGVIRKRLIPLNFLHQSGKEVSHKVAPSSEVIAVKSGKKAGMVSTALGSRGLGLLRIEEAFKGTANLVIKGEEDVKVEAVRPHWWPRDWFLEHEPHQAAR